MAENDKKEIVRLEDVRKEYIMGSTVVNALDGVSLNFYEGEFWALMGPSGSGKSTILNILGCLDKVTSGNYFLDRTNVAYMADDALSAIRLKRLGFIFQSFNLIPQLTVQKNIELPLYYLGWEDHESAERAKLLAEKVGLSERLGHRPNELSGGQRQRVAIARSLANDPQIILADEPTGNLDTSTGHQIMEMLCELHNEGKTIIMVTHEPEIAEYTSHQLHMRDGKIHEICN